MLKASRIGLLLAAMTMQMVGAPITGTLNIIGDVEVSAPGGVGNIDFLPPVGGGFGEFLVSTALSQTNEFVPLALTPGDIQDLNQAVFPVGVNFLLANFLTFDADADIVFDLRYINPGSFGAAACGAPAAAGQTCTPPGSPFNLSNQTSTESIASFSVLGDMRRVSTGEITQYRMVFSTQFSDQNYQNLLTTINTPGGAVRASFSAEATPIPEPGTLSLLAASGFLTGVVAFMRRRRA
jgi:hypothetical protein